MYHALGLLLEGRFPPVEMETFRFERVVLALGNTCGGLYFYFLGLGGGVYFYGLFRGEGVRCAVLRFRVRPGCE